MKVKDLKKDEIYYLRSKSSCDWIFVFDKVIGDTVNHLGAATYKGNYYPDPYPLIQLHEIIQLRKATIKEKIILHL